MGSNPLVELQLGLFFPVFKGYALHGSQVPLQIFLCRSAYSLNPLALAIKPIKTALLGHGYIWIDAAFESES